MAVAAGLAVANLYYAQPLLGTLSRSLSVPPGAVATLVTVTQVGYAVGLAFLVSLGDIWERRRLVSGLLLVTAGSAAGAALAPSLAWLEVAVIALGATSVVAQILVPLAADLSGERVRGRVVGTVMTGLLLGILMARTVSGALAQLAGWRAVFWLSASLMVGLSVGLRLVLPRSRNATALSYPRVLRSVVMIFAAEPILRRRSLYGALAFAGFSVFWTTAAFALSGPPYHYGNGVIGLFGLAGVAGAICASLAGRLTDRGWASWTTGGFLAIITGSFGLLALGGSSLLPFVVGVVLLDLGVQGIQVTNQGVIYRLRDDARSRINTAYMISYFAGGAAGSALAGLAWSTTRWAGVCALGALIGLVGLGVWGKERLGAGRHRTPRQRRPAVDAGARQEKVQAGC